LVGGKPELFEVDTIVVCAGQLPLQELFYELQSHGVRAILVGGAFEAAELDAKRAIEQACQLASVV
jgi:2,4-dienoyl-CoA reductase (NADPH2)